MQNQATERLQDQVEELKEAYSQERQSAKELALTAVQTSKEAVHFADDWVRYNAWKVLAVTLGIGLVAGLLMNVRSSRPRPERLPR
jgi:ElaB/YqjD/DUF883 family membrane-anchored ribosome-binding protein